MEKIAEKSSHKGYGYRIWHAAVVGVVGYIGNNVLTVRKVPDEV